MQVRTFYNLHNNLHKEFKYAVEYAPAYLLELTVIIPKMTIMFPTKQIINIFYMSVLAMTLHEADDNSKNNEHVVSWLMFVFSS